MPETDSSSQLLGHVHFDSPHAAGTLSELLALKGRTDMVFRNKYIKIDSGKEVHLLGRIIDGPFFVPVEVGPDSAFAQTAILYGEEFKAMHNYYVLARAEVLGELKDGRMFGASTRPIPKSPVYDLSVKEIEELIGFGGDMMMGSLVGYPGVRVTIDSKS